MANSIHKGIRGLCVAVAAGSIVVGGSVANAALTTVTFSGYVYAVQQTNTQLLSGIVPNGTSTRFTGGFSYDSGIADSAAGVTFGQYHGAVTGFYVDFCNGLSFAQDVALQQHDISTANDRTDYITPFDGFYAYSPLAIAGFAEPDGFAEVGIALQSDVPSALTSDALPTSLLFAPFLGACADSPLSAGDVGGVKAALRCSELEFHAVNTRTEQVLHLFGVIDEGRSSVQAPEPIGGGLLALGVFSLVRLRARRARSASRPSEGALVATSRAPVDEPPADARVRLDALEWQREWLCEVRRANLARRGA